MIGKKSTDRLKQEITWLKREKYGNKVSECEIGEGEEVRSRATRPNSARLVEFKKDLKRLNDGEPLDYVIGWREFLGCQIDLSAKPLIPRVETEFWVEQAIKELGNSCEVVGRDPISLREKRSHPTQRPLQILDLFAGSGCIGIAVLKHCLNTQVTFGEKDPKLCQQIKKNLKLNQISAKRAKVIQTNLFKPYCARLDIAQEKFDVIFANPPYISIKQKVQKSVKDWEPKEALFAGADGLAFIKKFLKQAKSHLNVKGKIYLELGYGQKTKIEKLIKQFDSAHCKQSGYTNWQFHRDQFGKWRWVVVEVVE